MKILLDTHAVFWWFGDAARLSKRAESILNDTKNVIVVSAASAWELAIKANLGKIDALELLADLKRHLDEDGFVELAISIEHATRAGLLPPHHRDPFDRLLVAQAQELMVPILSGDRGLDGYDIRRIW